MTMTARPVAKWLAMAFLAAAIPGWAESTVEKTKIDELIDIVNGHGRSAYLAAEALGHIGPDAKAATEALENACTCKNPRLRIAAAVALRQIDVNDPAAMKIVVKTLVAALTDEDPDIRREAVRGLSQVEKASPEELKAIATVLADSDDFVALHAADAMVEMGDRAVPLLAEATKNDKTVMWALVALGKLGPKAKSAQESIIVRLNDPNPIIKQEAALTLAAIDADPSKTVEALLPLLDDKSIPVRAAAAFAISTTGPEAERAKGKFLSMLDSDDELVRLIGARGLALMGPPSDVSSKKLIEVLEKGLADDRPIVRHQSAFALGHIGPAAASAKVALKPLLEDEVEAVREAAKKAIAEIDGKEKQ